MPNGNSDIKLLSGQVKVEAWDLCIDSKDRRKNNTSHRRALVHDFNDGLTINWDRDYPGGITLQGFVTIPDHLEVPGSTTLIGNARLEGGFEAFGDAKLEGKLEVRKLLINTTIMSPIIQPSGHTVNVPILIQIDVGLEIESLQKRVSKLEEQLASIQDNWRWCPNCQGLFFAGNPKKGVCPAGGEHSLKGSGNYHLLR